MQIALDRGDRQGDVRYTLDGSAPGPTSEVYGTPITLTETTTVRAQLFSPEGEAVGMGFSDTWYVVVEQPSLTVGKRTWASNEAERPGLANVATNGRVTLWEQWGGHSGDHPWIAVDLERPETLSRLQVQNFWDGYRYYQYTIDGSLDGVAWYPLVDFTQNTERATIGGYVHRIAPTEARYLRINLIYNSANPGLHLIEFSAWAQSERSP